MQPRKCRNLFMYVMSVVFSLVLITCSSKVQDQKKETVAFVGDEKITVQDMREMFGVRAAAHKAFNVTAERKKDALERLIAGKLLSNEGRRRGFDKSEEFKKRVMEREKDIYIAVLFKERVDSAVKIEDGTIKAEAQKMMTEDEKLSENEAMNMATQRLYQNSFKQMDNLLVQEVKGKVKVEMKDEGMNKIVSGEDVADETTLAIVDGTPVSYGEVKGELAMISGHGKKDLARDPRAIQAIIERISVREGLYNLARNEGVEKGDVFKTVKDNFESSLLIDYLIENDIREVATVTDEEMQKIYDEHPEMFEQGAKVRARHILVDDQKMAQEIYEKIKDGEDFQEMAKQFSKDPTATKGGDLGTFGRGVMVKPFEDVAFTMKVEEISEPVKTRFGYHIIQVTERDKGKKTPFSDAKVQLKKSLIDKKINAELQSLVESLKKGTEITVNESALESV